MKLLITKLFIVSFVTIVFLGCSKNTNYLYLGDRTNNKIIKVDMDNMKKISSLDSFGKNPYEIVSNDNNLYAINRSDNKIAVYKIKDLPNQSNKEESKESISLPMMPRSAVFKGDEFLLSSTSNAALMLINKTNNKLINTYSDGFGKEENYGGQYKSAHPFWVNKNTFILLDRSESSIELYNRNNTKPISKLNLLTSVHHIIYYKGFYFAAMEGKNKSNISPGILKFSINNNKLIINKEIYFSSFKDRVKIKLNKETWGGHHLSIDKKNEKVYMGSKEGNIFVLNTSDLTLDDIFVAGKGAGHIMLKNNKAIVTNHFDTFKTIYDTNSKTSFNIQTNEDKHEANHKYLQSHSSWYKDGFLYFISSSENMLVEVDLKNKKVSRKVKLGDNAYCLIGTKVSK